MPVPRPWHRKPFSDCVFFFFCPKNLSSWNRNESNCLSYSLIHKGSQFSWHQLTSLPGFSGACLGEHKGSPARNRWATLQMRGDFTKATKSARSENAPANQLTSQSPSQDCCQGCSSSRRVNGKRKASAPWQTCLPPHDAREAWGLEGRRTWMWSNTPWTPVLLYLAGGAT